MIKPILKVFIIALALSGCGEDDSQNYGGGEWQTPTPEGSFQEVNAPMISQLRDSCIAQSTESTVDKSLINFNQELLFAEANYNSCYATWGWHESCNADAMRLLTVMVGMVCNAY